MDYSQKPIELRAFDSLRLGFDFASDFRLKFAKSCLGGGRLVELDESRKRDIVLPGSGATIPGVSIDIHCDSGDHVRFKSDVLEFNQNTNLIHSNFIKLDFFTCLHLIAYLSDLPLTNLHDNLIITIEDPDGNQISHSGIRTLSIDSFRGSLFRSELLEDER
ncbi:hypothetical protein L2E82_39292 [Cichorium intybus]|uniref:Uncharacterized protein n=1 Tax=Cichorium intybus TaxID=13427 RepID=A0ACB9AIS4_CICIN|nr:hypothetical protein L2E82_39292 [Cichorium intybus]